MRWLMRCTVLASGGYRYYEIRVASVGRAPAGIFALVRSSSPAPQSIRSCRNDDRSIR